MGIVFKQSFANIITTYLGFLIGALNTLFLYTEFLDSPEHYGLIGYLLSASNLMYPLMAFGMHNTLIKFYSSYKLKLDQDRLLTLVLFFPIIAAAIVGGFGLFFYKSILLYFETDNKIAQPYIWLIFVIAFAMGYFEIFFAWAKVQLKSMFGNFMKEVFHRFCTALLLVGVYFKWISIDVFIYSLALVYLLRTIVMTIYAYSLRKPTLIFKLPENSKSVFKYSALILVAGSVAAALIDLDKVMIKDYLPIAEVAIYGIGVYIASVIAVPSRAMHQITYPLTAKLLNANDKIGLKELYQKSSLNLLIVAGFMFLLIITNVTALYELINDDYELYFNVVLLFAIAKLYDNLIGNTNAILFSSDYYRMVLVLGVTLVVMAFAFNIILIPLYGLEGAAMASFLAITIYNTGKLLFVYKKFKMSPFTIKTVQVLVLLFCFSLLFIFWDFTYHPIINILLKSICIALLYFGIVLKFKISDDIGNLLKSKKAKL